MAKTKQIYRHLRGYTLDPGFSTVLDTTHVNYTTYRIRWEDLTVVDEKTNMVTKLLGPAGEYFEVIDVDPAGNMIMNQFGNYWTVSGSRNQSGNYSRKPPF